MSHAAQSSALESPANAVRATRRTPDAAPSRHCMTVLRDAVETNILHANDWSQIQKLAEHLVRIRQAAAA